MKSTTSMLVIESGLEATPSELVLRSIRLLSTIILALTMLQTIITPWRKSNTSHTETMIPNSRYSVSLLTTSTSVVLTLLDFRTQTILSGLIRLRSPLMLQVVLSEMQSKATSHRNMVQTLLSIELDLMRMVLRQRHHLTQCKMCTSFILGSLSLESLTPASRSSRTLKLPLQWYKLLIFRFLMRQWMELTE